MKAPQIMNMLGACDRRRFLQVVGSGLITGLAGHATGAPFCDSWRDGANPPLRFGMIADVHHGLMPKAEERLEAFLEEAAQRDLDFLIQLGDFCHPHPDAHAFVKLWEQADVPRYHVLGNHDMDLGAKREIMDLWKMEHNVYSFDAGAYHFVVLDCNFLHVDGAYVDYEHGNFYVDDKLRTFIHPEQLEWLEDELASTNRQTIVFTHQALDEVWNGGLAKNRRAIRRIFAEANKQAGFQKVIACFSGHHHLDEHSTIDGIHYVQVNSASYYWVGEGYGRMAAYRDPLFAFVTVGAEGIVIEGRQSVFVAPTPVDLAFPDAHRLSASLSDRTLVFAQP